MGRDRGGVLHLDGGQAHGREASGGFREGFPAVAPSCRVAFVSDNNTGKTFRKRPADSGAV